MHFTRAERGSASSRKSGSYPQVQPTQPSRTRTSLPTRLDSSAGNDANDTDSRERVNQKLSAVPEPRSSVPMPADRVEGSYDEMVSSRLDSDQERAAAAAHSTPQDRPSGGMVSAVCVVSCRVVSCRVVSCRVVSCRVVSCRVVSCRVGSGRVVVVSCLVVSGRVWSCLVVSGRVVSCRVVSCRVVSCRVVSCRVVSCRVVPCRVVSCRAVPCVPCRAVPCRAVPCPSCVATVWSCYIEHTTSIIIGQIHPQTFICQKRGEHYAVYVRP